MRRNLISLLTLVISIIVILLLSQYFFSIKEPLPDAIAIESIFTLPVSDFQPEPNERKLFIVSALLTPILCGIIYSLLNRTQIALSKRLKLTARTMLATTPVLLCLLVYFSMGNTTFPFLALSSFYSHPFLTFATVVSLFLFLLASFAIEKKYPLFSKRFIPILYYGIGISLIGLISLETIHSDTEPVVFIRNSFEHLHFTAYFDAIAQTYLGKSPVELNPQYGYYPFFLNPLFKITGLTVLKFTIVMSLLKVIAYSGLLVTLRNVIDSWIIALTGFIAMIFYTRIRVPLDVSVEPYFQYNPHRLFFPALIIFLVWLYITRKNAATKNIIYGLTTFAASVSVLWNPDTGIIVFATWLIVLGYIEILELNARGAGHLIKRVVRHAVINFGALTLVILGFCAQAYLQNGSWPNLIQNFQYTSLFYNYGFYMLTLPRRLHPWMWVILPYIVGIYLSVSHLLDVNKYGSSSVPHDKRLDTNTILIFAISIIGTGVFTYYQGRSHNYNLIAISWPAYLLFTLYTDRLLKYITRITRRNSAPIIKISLLGRYLHQVIFFGVFFYFLGSSITSIFIHFPTYSGLIATRLSGASQTSQSLTLQSEFIRATSAPEDTVLILSDEATELYLYTNHQRPLDIPGFSELVVKADADRLDQFLMHPPKGIKIYWETSFRLADPRRYRNLTPTASSRNLILFESAEK